MCINFDELRCTIDDLVNYVSVLQFAISKAPDDTMKGKRMREAVFDCLRRRCCRVSESAAKVQDIVFPVGAKENQCRSERRTIRSTSST